MSLKYRRSIIFDQPHQTTAKMALETLVFDYKQRLQLNSRNKSEPQRQEAQRLTAGQAKCIQVLQAKLKTISFHTLHKQYHKYAPREERQTLDPEKMQLFRSGKFYRCSHRPREEQVRGKEENRRRELMEYFDRDPYEQGESETEVKERRRVGTQEAGRKRVHSSKKF